MKPLSVVSTRLPPIWLLTGCTASGKTELSLTWAERFGAEIVSCDSLLFYRGMDIGTAKPTAFERARLPHHLIDLLDPLERMDVKTYAGLASMAVTEIEARGKRVLVVGESGFYLKSFFSAVADDVPVDAALRAKLERDLQEDGLDAMVGRLRGLNAGGLGSLDVRNPRRVLRAMERCLVSGRPLLELTESFRAMSAPFAGRDLRLVEVVREPELLRARIQARAAAMVAGGLIDEVRGLRERGLERNPTAASAVGYRETLAWLDRPGSASELIEAIVRSTNRLARKQRTWFRRQLPPHRLVSADRDDRPSIDKLFDSEEELSR
ncbi:MAG TPA: tRNA (adenosine(37)-N6)-dimethylallyltransferase MiaA [Opitutaceae bacterium]